MNRKVVDIAVPDASPVLTLAGIGRIDLPGRFSVPIRVVDQVLRDHETGARSRPDSGGYTIKLNSSEPMWALASDAPSEGPVDTQWQSWRDRGG
jgi:hypothetical protein